mmetsp:Transcript_10561/g.30183  ORF Transcript_10561/g.30183 Transcript_10561/m.30183 type:complete len:459 (+) Transcript_10561:91-1467(+)
MLRVGQGGGSAATQTGATPGAAKSAPAPPRGNVFNIDARGPFFAVLVVGAFLLTSAASPPARPTATLPWTIDPTGHLGMTSCIALYALTVPGKEILNAILLFLGEKVFRMKRIDEGNEHSKVRKLEKLEAVDYSYLALNTIVEFLGMNHIVATLLYGPIEYGMSTFSALNGPLAFIWVMMINDLLYYPWHCIAHKRSFYPYCHKQHHRNFVPFRGYADAANQHPFEQTTGFSIFILSLHSASKVLGLHAGAAWVAFLSWAVLNICNHLAFDSYIHLPLPFPAYPHDHQMHHRFPQCNYSTLTTTFDRLFGSFRPYVSFDSPPPAPAKKVDSDEKSENHAGVEETVKLPEWAAAGGRPELLPAPGSFIGLLACLVFATVTLDIISIGGMPEGRDFAKLVESAILLTTAAVLCFAVEWASREMLNRKNEKLRADAKPSMAGDTVKPAMKGEASAGAPKSD